VVTVPVKVRRSGAVQADGWLPDQASSASMLRRLQATTARNRELAEDNQRLRHQLAHALGELRAAGIRLSPAAQSEDRAAAFLEDESAVIVDDRWRESTFIHAQTADGEW
jgi:hypothetical protein